MCGLKRKEDELVDEQVKSLLYKVFGVDVWSVGDNFHFRDINGSLLPQYSLKCKLSPRMLHLHYHHHQQHQHHHHHYCHHHHLYLISLALNVIRNVPKWYPAERNTRSGKNQPINQVIIGLADFLID